MKIVRKEVKSSSKVVGMAECPVYDTLPEMVEALGEATVLDLANTQNFTNVKNQIRSSATGKPSKQALRMQAIASIEASEFALVAGDVAKLENLINQKVQELEAKMTTAGPTVAEVAEDEDES